MKTHLPAQEDYYRLTRARELRRKAARLDYWRVAGTVYFLVTAGLLFLSLAMPPVGVGVGLLFLGGFAARPWARMEGQAARLRREADHLEAEHRARYGTLPLEQEL
jgi:hypothetical protein